MKQLPRDRTRSKDVWLGRNLKKDETLEGRVRLQFAERSLCFALPPAAAKPSFRCEYLEEQNNEMVGLETPRLLWKTGLNFTGRRLRD